MQPELFPIPIPEPMKPIRVQRKRTKGFKLPENTVCVNRGTKWGNPFKVGEPLIPTNKEAVDLYENWLDLQQVYYSIKADEFFSPPTEYEIVKELKGKNLACFCKDGDPCHADVLLKLANEPEPIDLAALFLEAVKGQ